MKRKRKRRNHEDEEEEEILNPHTSLPTPTAARKK